eukprot:TRINITY_DN14030_c0_g1_i1.p1 TRINITY_DN14030_c0_g1~~TRINITY_DN14030_c0_g1_i1.p1  ORF type:complete len:942 (-),score=259.78 TRINITY_DN14030_c0_g1_i1:410-3235(-)
MFNTPSKINVGPMQHIIGIGPEDLHCPPSDIEDDYERRVDDLAWHPAAVRTDSSMTSCAEFFDMTSSDHLGLDTSPQTTSTSTPSSKLGRSFMESGTDELDSMRNRLAGSEELVRTLKRELASLPMISTAKGARQISENAEVAVQELQKELKRARSDAKEHSRRVTHWRNGLKKLKNIIEEERHGKDEAAEKVSALSDQLACAREELEDSRAQADELAALREELALSKAEALRNRSELEAATEVIETAAARHRAQLDAAVERRADAEAEATQHRAELDAAKKFIEAEAVRYSAELEAAEKRRANAEAEAVQQRAELEAVGKPPVEDDAQRLEKEAQAMCARIEARYRAELEAAEKLRAQAEANAEAQRLEKEAARGRAMALEDELVSLREELKQKATAVAQQAAQQRAAGATRLPSTGSDGSYLTSRSVDELPTYFDQPQPTVHSMPATAASDDRQEVWPRSRLEGSRTTGFQADGTEGVFRGQQLAEAALKLGSLRPTTPGGSNDTFTEETEAQEIAVAIEAATQVQGVSAGDRNKFQALIKEELDALRVLRSMRRQMAGDVPAEAEGVKKATPVLRVEVESKVDAVIDQPRALFEMQNELTALHCISQQQPDSPRQGKTLKKVPRVTLEGLALAHTQKPTLRISAARSSATYTDLVSPRRSARPGVRRSTPTQEQHLHNLQQLMQSSQREDMSACRSSSGEEAAPVPAAPAAAAAAEDQQQPLQSLDSFLDNSALLNRASSQTASGASVETPRDDEVPDSGASVKTSHDDKVPDPPSVDEEITVQASPQECVDTRSSSAGASKSGDDAKPAGSAEGVVPAPPPTLPAAEGAPSVGEASTSPTLSPRSPAPRPIDASTTSPDKRVDLASGGLPLHNLAPSRPLSPSFPSRTNLKDATAAGRQAHSAPRGGFRKSRYQAREVAKPPQNLPAMPVADVLMGA